MNVRDGQSIFAFNNVFVGRFVRPAYSRCISSLLFRDDSA